MAGLVPATLARTNATCKRCSPGQQPSHAAGLDMRPSQRDLQRLQGRWYHSQGAAITALHAAGKAGG